MDRQLVLPRDRRRLLRPDPRGRGGRRHGDIARPRPHRLRRCRVHRRRRSGRPPPCRGLCVHVRCHGIADAQLLQRRVRARRATATTSREVQRLWLAGDQEAARKRVPTAIGLGTNLIGTDDIIRERLRLYRDAGITTLRVGLSTAGRTATASMSARPPRPAPRSRPRRERRDQFVAPALTSSCSRNIALACGPYREDR